MTTTTFERQAIARRFYYGLAWMFVPREPESIAELDVAGEDEAVRSSADATLGAVLSAAERAAT